MRSARNWIVPSSNTSLCGRSDPLTLCLSSTIRPFAPHLLPRIATDGPASILIRHRLRKAHSAHDSLSDFASPSLFQRKLVQMDKEVFRFWRPSVSQVAMQPVPIERPPLCLLIAKLPTGQHPTLR